MTRAHYETEADLRHEESAKSRIERAWGVRLEKLPLSYSADWAVCYKDGTVVGWIEYKRRNMDWGKYETVVLGARKIADMLRLAEFGQSAVFVVETNDGALRWIEINRKNTGDLRWGGRTTKQRDWQDREPVVHFPIKEFRTITS